MKQLELKHWLAYAPYHPMVYGGSDLSTLISAIPYDSDETEEIEIFLRHPIYGRISASSVEHSLVLHPLSDLTKEVEVNGEKFVPMEYFYKIACPNNTTYDEFVSMNIRQFMNPLIKLKHFFVAKLIEWRFDVFSLIPNGLAIDINTL